MCGRMEVPAQVNVVRDISMAALDGAQQEALNFRRNQQPQIHVAALITTKDFLPQWQPTAPNKMTYYKPTGQEPTT